MNYFYSAFGLNIESEMEIDYMENCEPSVPDVKIVYGCTPLKLEKPVHKGVLYEVAQNEFLLRVDHVANYYVKAGHTIMIEKTGDNDKATILYLVTSVFGALFYQRGLLPFHGSTLEINNKGVMILGLSGSGKSTLTTKLHLKGYKVLSDDISVVKVTNNVPVVFSSTKYIKLWKNVMEHFSLDPENFDRVRKEILKYRVLVKDFMPGKTVALKSIFVLSQSNTNEVIYQPMSGMEKFSLLRRNLYRQRFIAGNEPESKIFSTLSNIAQGIDVYKLERPKSGFSTSNLAKYIEKTVENA